MMLACLLGIFQTLLTGIFIRNALSISKNENGDVVACRHGYSAELPRTPSDFLPVRNEISSSGTLEYTTRNTTVSTNGPVESVIAGEGSGHSQHSEVVGKSWVPEVFKVRRQSDWVAVRNMALCI